MLSFSLPLPLYLSLLPFPPPSVESKCHICEDFVCEGVNKTCNYQLQGVSTSEISKNIPTVSDAPFAVNGLHRYDFGNPDTSHVCMFLSGKPCTSSLSTDYSNCPLRCWGYGLNGSYSKPQVGFGNIDDDDKSNHHHFFVFISFHFISLHSA